MPIGPAGGFLGHPLPNSPRSSVRVYRFQALAGSIGPSHAWVHAESFGGEVRVAGMTVRSDDLIHADRLLLARRGNLRRRLR